jgi:hypothetical protein
MHQLPRPHSLPHHRARHGRGSVMTAGQDVLAVIHAANCGDLACEGQCDLANIDAMAALIRELRAAKADEWFRR